MENIYHPLVGRAIRQAADEALRTVRGLRRKDLYACAGSQSNFSKIVCGK